MIREHEKLAPYTTFKIGGEASYFAEICSEQELIEALQFAEARALSVSVIGGGSNILVTDGVVPGVVLRMMISRMKFTEDGERCVGTFGAGTSLDTIVAKSVECGFWGIENLSWIPGTIGGAVVQNAGAYGVEIGQHVISVRVYDRVQKKYVTIPATKCRFSYRSSLFKEESERYIITEVTVCFSTVSKPQIMYKDLAQKFSDTIDVSLKEIRTTIIAIRSQKFPNLTKLGTAGSFFKNPIISKTKAKALASEYPGLPMHEIDTIDEVKISIAWILDHILHIKGERVGAVGTFEKQPLVLVNFHNANACEVDAYATSIEQRVYDKLGIALQREVVVIE